MQAEGRVGMGGRHLPCNPVSPGVTCFQLWEINLKITEIQEFIADWWAKLNLLASKDLPLYVSAQALCGRLCPGDASGVALWERFWEARLSFLFFFMWRHWKIHGLENGRLQTPKICQLNLTLDTQPCFDKLLCLWHFVITPQPTETRPLREQAQNSKDGAEEKFQGSSGGAKHGHRKF